jgi:hypothetical protein
VFLNLEVVLKSKPKGLKFERTNLKSSQREYPNNFKLLKWKLEFKKKRR